jgi:hypothetical protein
MSASKKQKAAEALETRWIARRKKLPPNVVRDVFIECGHKCANPACRFSLLLEAHHILWVKDGGNDEAGNLLALCPNCHGMHTRGLVGYEAIWHWKRMLVMLNHAYDKQGIDQLLFLYKMANVPVWCDGGALERYSALIGNGLAAVVDTRHKIEAGVQVKPQGGGTGPDIAVEAQFITSSHRVELTARGRMLVEAWLSEDRKRYEELFGGAEPKCK